MDRRRFIKTLGAASAAAAGYAAGLIRPVRADPIPCDMTVSGDFAGTIPAGETWLVDGDLNLTGDLVVEGVLAAQGTWEIAANGHEVLVQHGGRLELSGVEKTAWCRWGETPVGWQVGDRLAVAPTAAGVYEPSETTWAGSWADTSRPPDAPDVPLVDGCTALPEVVNLSQTGVISGAARVMFHMAAGIQSLRWVNVKDSGVSGELGFYPLHFHQNYDSTRGSLVESVVVEGGRNHAFVPHGSHGIAFPGCAAYDTTNVPFWWDKPIPGQTPRDITNDSEDVAWDGCLALRVGRFPGDSENNRMAGFWLGSGKGLSCVGSVAAAVDGHLTAGPRQRSGFHWPEAASMDAWDFRDCVAHNNMNSGIFVWQNTETVHTVLDFVAYRNGAFGVDHGAYVNPYLYEGLVLSENVSGAVKMHATSRFGTLTVEDLESAGILFVPNHNVAASDPVVFRRCGFTQVVYNESPTGQNHSFFKFEDCGLVPADFDLTVSNPASLVEIYEAGTLLHCWESGSWS